MCAEIVLRGGADSSAASAILATEFFKDPSIRQQARDFMEACATLGVKVTEKGMTIIDEYHLYSVSFRFQARPVVTS